MQQKSIDHNGNKIFYRVTGTGRTVVLLHGFAEDGNIWQSQTGDLKQFYRLVIPDIPGSGQSPLIRHGNIETYASVLKAILDAELKTIAGHQEKATIIGHSMGGYITLAFAEKHPEYINALGLFHSTASADTEEKKQTRAKAIDFIQTNGGYAFLKTSLPGLFTKNYIETHPGKVALLIEEGRQFSNEALIQYYEAMIKRPDRRWILQNCNYPVLFIMGEYDTAVPLQNSLQQCYLSTQSHIHLLEHSAHMGMLEETTKANRAILDFLKYADVLIV